MNPPAEKLMEHPGETRGYADHDHQLSRRLDALWCYDQRLAIAARHPGLQAFWRDLKHPDYENVTRLKELLGEEIQKGCF